jgi:hypothetical protein
VNVEKFVDVSEAGQYRVKWFSYPVGLALSPALAFTLRAGGTLAGSAG